MEKTKILVVEDESIVARDIRNMLLGLGYDVTAVISDAKEAVKTTQKEGPHLVLMDIMLQGDISGVEAADQIYSELNIPVVYLTAYADETTLQRAKETAPFGYLLKPFEERELKSTIEIALYKFGMEMKLKERERWLTTLLKSIEDGVIATDTKGNITFMNPLAETLTGWQQVRALDKPLNKIYKLLDIKKKTEPSIAIREILKGEEYSLPRNIALVSKKGKKIPIDHRAAPITDETGNTSGVVLAFRDITRQKETEEELIQSYDRLKQAMEGTVQAMAYTIETRDPYTAGHQRRVTQLACALAEKMGLPTDVQEGVRMAGDLHDIGKIYVPAEILSKPGKLSEAEYNIIKTHSQVGYDILKTIEFPWPIADIVLQHHERMDGSGYPAGLRGDDILLEARILAVADVIEAMATHRPYRPALSIEDALEEISEHKGKLYDLQVVEACLEIFEEGFAFEEK
ncbi:MAG: HD domain-containing phosphohydrolase [Candidatus Aminicenantes bacterium]|jgi:PAS domain S-box-containing protein/putative nucleotidyltransferase with HDIG domain